MYKKVYFSLVQQTDMANKPFEELLLMIKDKNFIMPYNHKRIELSHIIESGDFISGIFVSTQINNIAPVHGPGNEEDYSAVIIEDGKGFAYPNVILYHKITKVLLWENNRDGVTEKIMLKYFNEALKINDLALNQYDLTVINNIAPEEQFKRFKRITEAEIKVIEPMLDVNQMALSEVCDIAAQFNASKSISIYIKADDNVHGLCRSFLESILNKFKGIQSPKGKEKNKLIITGAVEENGEDVERMMNYVINRLTAYFQLEYEPCIQKDLQIKDRVKGIKETFRQLESLLYAFQS